MTLSRSTRQSILKHLMLTFVEAASDASRAWSINPNLFALNKYEVQEGGGRRLVSRRAHRLVERYLIKFLKAVLTFWHSTGVRLAKEVFIPRLGGEGLLANLLHVIEVLHRVRPEARVQVDWSLTGKERGFRYGQVGEDVWTGLFHPLATC